MSKESASCVRPPPVVRRSPTDGRPKNRLLAALPADAFRRLLPHLKTVAIRTRQVLQKQGEPLRQVYFPNGGVVSITTVLSDGTTVEAATVGDEGMLGIDAFLRDDAVAPGRNADAGAGHQCRDAGCRSLPPRAREARRAPRPHGTLHAGRHRADDADDGVQRAASCTATPAGS